VNGNGQQEAGEPGLAGVSVTLKTCANVVVATTVSDINGWYMFYDLVPGCYVVAFGVPPGMFPTLANIGSDYTDSDIDQSGESGQYWLNPGVSTATADAGFTGLPSSVGNFVWNDVSGNGRQDAAEVGLSGVTVVLKTSAGASVATTVTNGTGYYSFDNIAPGSYSVEFSGVPAGFVPTAQNVGPDDSDSDISPAGATSSFDLVAGVARLDIDAGFVASTGISGMTWNDANSDGVQQLTEAPLTGVSVTLKACDGTVVATTLSSVTGNYSFDNLVPGCYYVVFGVPPTMSATKQDVGTDDTIDSDININGQTAPINLVAGSPVANVAAGFIGTPASVGDFVWNDQDYDGVQQVGEPGLAGVTVTLQTCGTNAVVATASTDATGLYTFSNLAPGCYHLVFANAPAGFVASLSRAGSDSSLDSDINANGEIADFTAIGTMTGLDAGFVNSSSTFSLASFPPQSVCTHTCVRIRVYAYVCVCVCICARLIFEIFILFYLLLLFLILKF